jgi:hypothetical protein
MILLLQKGFLKDAEHSTSVFEPFYFPLSKNL